MINEGYYDAYQLGFNFCKMKIAEAFPKLNLNGITSVEPKADEIRGTKVVSKANAELGIELDSIDKAITKVMKMSR